MKKNEVRISTFSSREFNQDVSKAKRAALAGPVFITDRGQSAYVLLTIKEYQKLADAEKTESVIDLLAMPGTEDIDFDPPKWGETMQRPVDFS
jgi:PHD/YefM family antitoxin component YafN of YafNO toxin-antitoxin module